MSTPRSFFRSFSSKRVLYFVSASIALATWTGCEVDTSPIGDTVGSSSISVSASASSTSASSSDASSADASSSSGGSVVVVGETGGAPSVSSASVVPTSPSPAIGAVGRGCSADADCAGGLFCLNDYDDVIGGGVAGGYCSAPCKGDDDCAGDARCDKLGGVSVCVKTCHVGASATDKCFGRSDVACTRGDDVTTRGFCLPQCGSDAECEDGFNCGSNGLCMHAPEAGASLGTACTLNDGTCWSFCESLSFVTVNGMCSATCVFGGDPKGQCGGVEKGYCGLPAIVGEVQSVGDGDAASCAPRCDETSDCPGDLLCLGVAGVGGHGYCVAPTSCAGNASACDAVRADFPDVQCMATKRGPECADPAYAPPL